MPKKEKQKKPQKSRFEDSFSRPCEPMSRSIDFSVGNGLKEKPKVNRFTKIPKHSPKKRIPIASPVKRGRKRLNTIAIRDN